MSLQYIVRYYSSESSELLNMMLALSLIIILSITPKVRGILDCNICSCTFNSFYCNSGLVTEIPFILPYYNSQYVTRISLINTNIKVLRANNFNNFYLIV